MRHRFLVRLPLALPLFDVLRRHPPTQRRDAHPTRQMLLEVIAESPGIPLNKLRSRVAVGWGTLYHHVRRLEKEGAIEMVVAGRRRLFYIPGMSANEELQARALIEGATAQIIASEIEAQPGVALKELVRLTGQSERAVYYHVKRLMEANLVESRSKGRHYGLRPTPLLIRCLSRVR